MKKKWLVLGIIGSVALVATGGWYLHQKIVSRLRPQHPKNWYRDYRQWHPDEVAYYLTPEGAVFRVQAKVVSIDPKKQAGVFETGKGQELQVEFDGETRRLYFGFTKGAQESYYEGEDRRELEEYLGLLKPGEVVLLEWQYSELDNPDDAFAQEGVLKPEYTAVSAISIKRKVTK